MSAAREADYDSPAMLVAIIVAARRAGDRELERDARQKLLDRHGVRLNFTHAAGDRQGVPHE
ncbi:MAG: hypothetical protein FJ276_33305 [Planctomycetes bacterium]|nr:hypothetical protein [Planctomycetota bacterium]